jgi:hypothetical protein
MSPDWWLAYRAKALLDLPPEQDAQAVGDTPAIERVRAALVERDDALRRAHEDLAGARPVAATWEAEVATARAQLLQDRAALEGARTWQNQDEKKAKEVEGLRMTLSSKSAALAAVEEQLRLEGVARQQVEARFQQEQAALTEARPRLSGCAWRGRRRWVSSGRSAPHSRGRKPPSSSGRTRCRGSTGNWSRPAFGVLKVYDW